MIRLFITTLFLSQALLAIAIVPFAAAASSQDREFIYEKMKISGCPINTEVFADSFAQAIDRLESINSKLVEHIRHVSYLESLSIKCDLPASSEAIWWLPEIRTIRLRENTPDNWKTVANVFHEFLHFVGVKVDLEYHHRQDIDSETLLKTDFVYACHVAVFPELAENPKLEIQPQDITNARSHCTSATVE